MRHNIFHGSSSRAIFHAATVLFGAAICHGAAAQSNPVSSTSDQNSGLEEIVVTAQRRRQTLQEAPLEVSYLSSQATADLDIRDLEQVQMISPDLSFSHQVGYAQIFIRGIGANYANPGLETPVAIYQDDAYQTAGNTSISQTLDVDSVQVLNGPQGTLYGRNASGGVILLNTANPTDKQEATVSAEYGRFEHALVDLVVNTPLTSDLNVRIAARYGNDGGFIHNEFDGNSVGGGSTGIVRGKADWHPGAVPGLDVQWESEYDYGYVHHDYSAERLPAPLCLGCALGAKPPSGFYDVNENGDFPFKTQSTLNILHVTDSFEEYTVKSVTSYHYSVFSATKGSDQDYTTIDLERSTEQMPTHTVAEDLSLQSNYQGPFNFISGATYIRDDRKIRTGLDGLLFAPFVTGISNFAGVLTNSVSAFAEGTYKFTDAFSFTAGGRYNLDRRVLDSENSPEGVLIFGTAGFQQHVVFHSFTPRFVLQYDTPIGNAYLSYTKGFKAGGLNSPAFTEGPVLAPERIHSTELGLKSVWMDKRVQTNFDVFQYKVSDLQVSVTDILAGGDVTENAAAAKGTGVEFTSRFAATSSLILGGGGDYLHARFVSYPNATTYCPPPAGPGLAGCTENLAGTPLARAPQFTAYGTAEYHFVPFSGYKAAVAVLAHWSDDFLFFAGGGGPLGLDKQSPYWLVNLNAWVTPDDERYRVGIYVDNATATKYFDFATTADLGAYYQAAPPITFGVKFQHKFGGG